MRTPSNNGQKTRRGVFQPGNKHGRGRPEGSRNKASLAIQALLDGECEAITRKAVEMAKAGDTTAIRLCLERLLPPARDRGIRISLPVIKSTGDVLSAIGEVLQSVATGELTPMEAQNVAGLLESYRRTAETTAIEERITELEKRITSEQSKAAR
ncbi:MAG: hypothetical protein ACR2JB_14920 [Bryobacteraceae bacterium]